MPASTPATLVTLHPAATGNSRVYSAGMRLATAVALLGIALLLGGCAGLGDLFKEPTFRLDRVALRDVGLRGGALDLVIAVDNPNQFDLHGTSLTVGFDVEQSHLGDVRLTNDFAVTKGGVTTLTLPLGFEWAGVGSAVRAALSSGEIPYSMKGQARLQTPFGQYDVPFQSDGRVPVTMPQGVLPIPSGP
jgi:LEA14-like dessication related protein